MAAQTSRRRPLPPPVPPPPSLACFTVPFLIKILLYVGTGILQPILIDHLRLASCMGRRALLLPTLANVLGMATCGILSTRSDRSALWRRMVGPSDFRRRLLLTAVVDLTSGMVMTGGLLLTGGAVFVVIDGSVPAWTALLAWHILGRKPTSRQVLGVLVVSAGLVANVLGTAGQTGWGGDGRGTATVGSAVVLVGCILHSLFFVLLDRSLRRTGRGGSSGSAEGADIPVPPALMSSFLGSMEAVVMSLWVLVGVAIGGFHDQGTSAEEAATGDGPHQCDPSSFAGGFALLLVVDAVHAAAFFLLLRNLGAVGSSLLKGVRSVAVVLLSAALYCPREAAQCLSRTKELSIALVVSGTVMYASAGDNGVRNGGNRGGNGSTGKDGPLPEDVAKQREIEVNAPRNMVVEMEPLL